MKKALLLLAIAAPAAVWACGVCIEDKVAATYDHAVVQRAAATGKAMVYCEIHGSLDTRRWQGAARQVRGLDPASVRVSQGAGRHFIRAGHFAAVAASGRRGAAEGGAGIARRDCAADHFEGTVGQRRTLTAARAARADCQSPSSGRRGSRSRDPAARRCRRAALSRMWSGLRSAGDHAGHGRLRQHEFQQQLVPAGAADLLGPARQRLLAQGLEHLAAAEGQVDQHRDAALGGQRQQAPLGVAVGDRIVELHEVDGARRASPARVRRGPSRCSGSCRCSEMRPAAFQSRSVARWVRQSCRLCTCIRSMWSVRSRAIERSICSMPARLPAGPDLGGQESALSRRGLIQQLAHHLLGAAVHRRTVDHAARRCRTAPPAPVRAAASRAACCPHRSRARCRNR